MNFLDWFKRTNPFTVFFVLSAFLLLFFLNFPNIQNAGDIIEYYGITESILNHGSVRLTDRDKANLKKSISAKYFEDDQYYLKNNNNDSYPVHFFAYSLINVPVRLGLRLINQPERMTFTMTNLLILSASIWYIMNYLIHKDWQRWILLAITYLSPLIFFISFPGPDVYIISLILVSLFLFANKKNALSILAAVIASWQSQPLIFIPLALFLYSTYLNLASKKYSSLIRESSIIALVLIPNIYSLYAFGALSPWSFFEGRNLVSTSNVSVKKFIELFFDPNIGIFWYAPLALGASAYFLSRNILKGKLFTMTLSIALIATGIAYSLNANWNNGTAGFGPTRYVEYIIPLMIFIIVTNISQKKATYLFLVFMIVSQLVALSANGYLKPDFRASLQHSPYAKHILENYPSLYNPTAEIFIERTLHDEPYPYKMAIYSKNGNCLKVYVPENSSEIIPDSCHDKKIISGTKTDQGTYVNYK